MFPKEAKSPAPQKLNTTKAYKSVFPSCCLKYDEERINQKNKTTANTPKARFAPFSYTNMVWPNGVSTVPQSAAIKPTNVAKARSINGRTYFFRFRMSKTKTPIPNNAVSNNSFIKLNSSKLKAFVNNVE